MKQQAPWYLFLKYFKEYNTKENIVQRQKKEAYARLTLALKNEHSP